MGRLRRNFGVLLTGGVAVSVLGFATVAFNARALTPAELGTLAILEASVIFLGQIFSFDTWQGLIKHGSQALEEDSPQQFHVFAMLAFGMDLLTSIGAGIAAVILLLTSGAALGLSDDLLAPSILLASTLFTQMPGAPVGVLRVFDRFAWLSALGVAQAGVKLLVAVSLYVMDAPLAWYIYGYAAVLFLHNIGRIMAALFQLKKATGFAYPAPVAAIRPHVRSFLRFSTGSWATATMNIARQQGMLLIVASTLGTAGAGFFSVAQRIVAPIAYLAEPLRQAMFPELSRLVAKGRHRDVLALIKSTLVYTIPMGLAIILGGLAFGGVALKIVAGDGYVIAYWAMVQLIIGRSLYLCAPFLYSLVILYAGMRVFVISSGLITAVWVVVSFAAIHLWGLNGAGTGPMAFVLLSIGFSTWLIWPHYRRSVQAK